MSSTKIQHYYNIVLVNWQLMLKSFELVSYQVVSFVDSIYVTFQFLAILNIAVIYQPAHVIGFGVQNLGQIGVMYTTYSTSMLTAAVILLGYMIGERFPFKTHAIFCFSYSLFYFIVGGLLTRQSLQLWNPVFHPSMENYHLLLASVFIAFFSGIVLLFDAVLTVLKTESF